MEELEKDYVLGLLDEDDTETVPVDEVEEETKDDEDDEEEDEVEEEDDKEGVDETM